MITKVKLLSYIKIVFLIYPLVLLYWNYIGDGNDLIEIVPKLNQWLHPELYPTDFYLNYIKPIPLYERTVSLLFLFYIGATNPYILFIVHGLFTCFLIIGLFKVIQVFISLQWLQLLLLLTIFIICQYTSVGSNELYYNMAVPSLFAKTFGVWAIYFLLTNRYFWFTFCLIISCFFQPLVGLQLSILWIGSKVIQSHFTNSGVRQYFKYFLFFICFTFPYYLFLVFYTQAPHAHDHFLFDILEFRIGHHFLIEYSGIGNIVLYLLLYFSGLYFWNSNNKLIYYFYLLQGVILIIYSVGTSLYHSELLLKFQWLKSTIWIELFSLIALGNWVEHYFTNKNYNKYGPWITSGMYSSMIILALVKWGHTDIRIAEERTLGLWAREHTPIHSLFVVPADFTYFKINSERSSWVDYKAIAHHPQYLFPWFDRIHRIYHIDLTDRRNHIDLQSKANTNFKQISKETLIYLGQNQLADYIILPVDAEMHSDILSIVFSTKSYRIFKFN